VPGTILLQETLPKEKRTTESTFKSIISLTEVVENKNFSSLLLISGLLSAPFMAYLGLASFIYIDTFGVSETTFSVYFAITSALTVLGPILYMRFGNPSVKGVFWLGFAIAILSALALFFIGELSPIVLLLCFVPFAVVNTYYRPMISDMLLSTLKSNVGAVASVMNFSCTVIGGIGMKKAIFSSQ
jgi:DHA1 family bicyclomycin/chloramphenicol resistance-like MFS transporter